MRLGVYFVTPDGAGPDLVRAALRGGCKLIQLRDKGASDQSLADLAALLLPEVRAHGATLIVNDRLAVAKALGIGLHIGQSDGDPIAIRAALGAGPILGLSIETEAQARRIPPGIDYIGAGPYRATATKPDAAAPLGLAGLAAIRAATALPIVAIGGIAAPDLAPLAGLGLQGVALVSAIAAAPDPETATRQLCQTWASL
jgi:thiamine-phosphate pyrophosphorylase